MPDIDFATFPLATKGNRFSDFEIGQVFRHHWGRTITEADNVIFSASMCAWNPLYLNVEYAQSIGFPTVVVNPMLILCTVVGLSVEDLSEIGGPFLGIDECTFGAIMHPGDTVSAWSAVMEKRDSASRPDAGIVTWQTQATNQREETVISFKRTNLVSKAPKP